MSGLLIRTCAASEAVNLRYKIKVADFVKSPLIDSGSGVMVGWKYAADLVVDKMADNPDIPPSTWIVTLEVPASGEKVEDSVKPKGSRTGPRLVLLDWSVRLCVVNEGKDGEGEMVSGDVYGRLGPDGFVLAGGFDLQNLKERRPLRFGEGSEPYYVLKEDPMWCVGVSPTFMVEKGAERRDLRHLLESGLLADCTLICDGRDFPAHRAILAAASPVLAAMFHNEMQEKVSGICTIKDMHPDVLGGLLGYIYSRDLTKTEGLLRELWMAADKYDIADVKVEVERLMLQSLSDETALDLLNFAARHGLHGIFHEAAQILARRPCPPVNPPAPQ